MDFYFFHEFLQNTVDKLVQRANASLLVGTSSWKEQFMEAITVNGGKFEKLLRVLKQFNKGMDLNFAYMFTGDDEGEDGEERAPSCGDYVMHFLTIFWKVIFAFVPPTGKWNGKDDYSKETQD